MLFQRFKKTIPRRPGLTVRFLSVSTLRHVQIFLDNMPHAAASSSSERAKHFIVFVVVVVSFALLPFLFLFLLVSILTLEKKTNKQSLKYSDKFQTVSSNANLRI